MVVARNSVPTIALETSPEAEAVGPPVNTPHEHIALLVRGFMEYATQRGAGFPVSRQTFFEYLDQYLTSRAAVERVLSEVRVEDVLLLCGALQGRGGALQRLDALLSDATRYASNDFKLDKEQVDEFRQTMREYFLMRRGDRPAQLLLFSGRGSFKGWLRTVVRRRARHYASKCGQRDKLEEAFMDVVSAKPHDPELSYVKKESAQAVKVAFREALGRADRAEQALLRNWLVDSLKLCDIAGLYDVDPSTVGRRLRRARDRLVKNTRRILVERLCLSPAEVDSLIGLIRSRLDVSLSRLLGGVG